MPNKPIALIPARIGSKRIIEKNIKLFAGKPMLQYAIEVCQQSQLFSQIIVSTDSEKVKSLALSLKASVPFLRPSELADDFTPTYKVIEHGLNWLSEHQKLNPQYLCCVYPTVPLLKAQQLQAGFKILLQKKAGSVFAVTHYDFTIFRALKTNSAGALEMFWPEHELTRSNDLPEAFHDAGQFYWLDVEIFKKTKKVWAPPSYPLLLSRQEVCDIDTTEDWEFAEKLWESQQ